MERHINETLKRHISGQKDIIRHTDCRNWSTGETTCAHGEETNNKHVSIMEGGRKGGKEEERKRGREAGMER